MCHCNLRASRRISRTEANPNRKFFGCPLYKSADDKGCGFFLWFDMKVQEDVRKLTHLVGHLSLQLRRAQGETHELDSTSERVKNFPYDEASSSCSVYRSESSIVGELEVIKARLSRLEAAVFK
ncbi:hypothetical protein LINPERPRIM_LOCUS1157 [Linum perenne]